MDNRTQQIDPNRTMLSGSPTAVDPMRTQAMSAFDPLKTTAMAAMPGGKALIAEVIAGRDAAMANGPAREQYLVDFIAGGAPGGGLGARTPLNLCLVIDRSGSMEGPPLDYVKQACSYVVDLLGPNDILSIVTFRRPSMSSCRLSASPISSVSRTEFSD
ncbi:MAG: hypothetical protein IT203_09695 [Fimbriimonadaceae bacterium]|nr:hypothetical protein [Fimbriimonadaceae bacterium]